MIRLILFGIVMVTVLFWGLFLWVVIWITRLFNKEKAEWISLRFVQFACRAAIFALGVKIDARGTENVSSDRAVVYVMNHRSIFDIITTYPFFKTRTGFVAKKELAHIPVFSYWLKLANGLFLDRQNIREGLKTILAAVEKVKGGVSMCIFPEGTRNKDQESKTSLLEFHDASFKLAEKAHADIIPVALYNMSDCFEDHKPKMKAAHVKITFGKPIVLDELEPEQRKFIGRYVQGVFTDMLKVYEEEEKQQQ